MKRRRMSNEQILDALETILAGATETKAWAPAIRAAELLGKQGGLWKSEAEPQTSLADMINEAAKAGDDERQP
jgi:hypothetical protein